MKIRKIIKLIEKDGWYLICFKGRVTIAGGPNDDIAPGTLNSILKQASLKRSNLL